MALLLKGIRREGRRRGRGERFKVIMAQAYLRNYFQCWRVGRGEATQHFMRDLDCFVAMLPDLAPRQNICNKNAVANEKY